MKKRTKKSKPTRADVEKIYWWCVSNYGRSKVNGPYPDLQYRKADYLTEGIFGEYDWIENTIFVSKDKNKTLIDVIDTMIHEWVHYQQPLRSHLRTMAKEGKLDLAFEDGDPLETEARIIARKDRSRCFRELFS